MKKILIAFVMLFGAFAANAQRASEATIWNEDYDFNHSGFFLNPTIGVMTGDRFNGFGFDITAGYRWHAGSGFNWDILKVGMNTETSYFGEMFSLRFLSGFRYNSPALFAGKGLYVDFGLGYQVSTYEGDLSGFAYEVGAGVNLTRLISLGLVWEGNNTSGDVYEGSTRVDGWGLFGVRLGLNF
ncbi:MAG: hypothetical protein K2L74_01665 [Muribaculaceae bacterium]|nr:hypothetical protein [Muribaculaceae bacterium]